MIDEEKNPFVYDWDRSYCRHLGDNPILSNNVCESPCSSSQCNIFIATGRPIDLIKLLRYTITAGIDEDDEDNSVLFAVLECMNVRNTLISYNGRNIPKYSLIFGFLESFNYFFRDEDDDCSYLYREPPLPTMKLLIDLLGGTWPLIADRAFSLNPDSIPEIVTEIRDSGFGFTSVDDNVRLRAENKLDKKLFCFRTQKYFIHVI
jgi:hypothetical protein